MYPAEAAILIDSYRRLAIILPLPDFFIANLTVSHPESNHPNDRSQIDTPDLSELVSLFYSQIQELGQFAEVEAAELPEDERTLLAHNNHMTVTVENFHHTLVDVEVAQTNVVEKKYAREILLRRQSDRAVVQYGIMRVDFQYLENKVRQEIESQQTPLGRVLIENNVLRDVQLQSLWKITPTAHLKKLLEYNCDASIFGRTALIYCNGQPGIELLEIVVTQ